MNTVTVFRRASGQQRARTLKAASREIFAKRGASQGRSAAYRFVVPRDFACTYDEARQDRQFLQTDPVGYDAGDMNLHAYVGNDPLNRTDPSGQICVGQSSDYCDRSDQYAQYDEMFSDAPANTTYFGAVSDMTANLANMDLPGGHEIAGLTPEVDAALNDLSQGILDFNEGQVGRIESGQITETGSALDARLVADEQGFIQGELNQMQSSNPGLYNGVISTMNFNANRTDLAGSVNAMTDPNIAQAANLARAELGRPINFANEHDRNVMGRYMAQVRRQ